MVYWPAPPEPHDVAELRQEARLAERRQGHHLVLVGGVQKSEISGDRLVEQAERVRHVDLAEPLQAVAGADGVAGGGLLAAAVERQHGGVAERRGVKGAGGVGQVVRRRSASGRGRRRAGTPRKRAWRCSGAPSARWPGALAIDARNSGSHADPKPSGVACRPGSQRERDRGVVAPPAEQQVRVERIGDVIDCRQGDASLAQAVVDGVEGQLPRRERHRPLAVLDVREALLLGGRDHPAVGDETGRGVVKGGVDAERVHGVFSLGCEARVLRQQIPVAARDHRLRRHRARQSWCRSGQTLL